MEVPNSVVDLIITLYEKYGNADYIGEPVSQIEHMCQAAQLAEAEGYPEEVILAAFFHDLGHLCEHFMPVAYMGGYGVIDHEKLGADFLRQKGFSQRICKLVESHVAAKRYLTFKYPDYYTQLSEASRRTLEFQGGVMTQEEAKEFEADPDATLILALRKWDEAAKLENIPLPKLEKYAAMMHKHLIQQQTL
ncbi:MAG TPA: HD domain-containing protein [Sediminibacterium sp.]|jgi:phosphonate degradation associated HDIG domain protein|nr:HD domain-containing protein [Sediminibacterium sp.]HQS56478.1 HD domain-containing protein [Sediminibacterium sp.]